MQLVPSMRPRLTRNCGRAPACRAGASLARQTATTPIPRLSTHRKIRTSVARDYVRIAVTVIACLLSTVCSGRRFKRKDDALEWKPKAAFQTALAVLPDASGRPTKQAKKQSAAPKQPAAPKQAAPKKQGVFLEQRHCKRVRKSSVDQDMKCYTALRDRDGKTHIEILSDDDDDNDNDEDDNQPPPPPSPPPPPPPPPSQAQAPARKENTLVALEDAGDEAAALLHKRPRGCAPLDDLGRPKVWEPQSGVWMVVQPNQVAAPLPKKATAAAAAALPIEATVPKGVAGAATVTTEEAPASGAVVMAAAPIKAPTSMAQVVAYLERIKLQQYAAQFDEQGYDDLDFLLKMDDAMLTEVARAVGMKRGHEYKFVTCFATGYGGGGASA